MGNFSNFDAAIQALEEAREAYWMDVYPMEKRPEGVKSRLERHAEAIDNIIVSFVSDTPSFELRLTNQPKQRSQKSTSTE